MWTYWEKIVWTLRNIAVHGILYVRHGFDNISNILLKKVGPLLLNPLVHLLNGLMAQGIFPCLMKQSEVVPLYKSKEWHIECNYWQISLLTTISKLLEKVMYRRVYTFLELVQIVDPDLWELKWVHKCQARPVQQVPLTKPLLMEQSNILPTAKTKLQVTVNRSKVLHPSLEKADKPQKKTKSRQQHYGNRLTRRRSELATG